MIISSTIKERSQSLKSNSVFQLPINTMAPVEQIHFNLVSETCINELKENGFSLLPNFVDEKTVNILKTEAEKLIKGMPPPKERVKFDANVPDQHQVRFDSINKIDYFYGHGALDDNGELLAEPHLGLKIVGYGLHRENEVFRNELFCDKVRDIYKRIGYEKPVVIQSLLHFSGKSGAAPVHQDTTYMICDPPNIVGMYIALDDADLDNGCVWFLRGSHTNGPQRLMKRDPKRKLKDGVVFDAPPVDMDTKDFVPVVCQKGDAILFDGNTFHFSGANKSGKRRDAFIFQVMDSKQVKWSQDNWAQPEKGFEALYKQ